MWRLIAPCVTDNSPAAAVMLRSRATASKARRALSDGLEVCMAVEWCELSSRAPQYKSIAANGNAS
jgi:hypothetical protein